MALRITKPAAATAIAAAFSLLATPVAAVELPRPVAAKAYDGDALNAERHRRRGWRGRGHRGDGIDAGDVLAGVLILGGIAAIASAASQERAEDRYPARYPDEVRYRASDSGRFESRGMDRAVDMCVAEVERGQGRVASVDSAARDAEGWRVAGELESGAGYWCTIDNAGQISGVGGSGTAEAEPAGAYDDDYYARAREAQRGGSAEVDGDLSYRAAGLE